MCGFKQLFDFLGIIKQIDSTEK